MDLRDLHSKHSVVAAEEHEKSKRVINSLIPLILSQYTITLVGDENKEND